MPAAPRRYLIVVPRPMPATPLAVRRTSWCLGRCPDRYLRRHGALAAGEEEDLADEQKRGANKSCFICTEACCPSRRCTSKSWRLGGSLAAQTHTLAVFAPPAPVAQCLGEASGIDAPLSACSHVLYLSLCPGRCPDRCLMPRGASAARE